MKSVIIFGIFYYKGFKMKRKIFLVFLVLGLTGANAEESTWEKVKDGAGKFWGDTKEAAEDASESDTAESIKDGAGKAWDKTKDVSGDAWEGTKSFFKETKDKLTED